MQISGRLLRFATTAPVKRAQSGLKVKRHNKPSQSPHFVHLRSNTTLRSGIDRTARIADIPPPRYVPKSNTVLRKLLVDVSCEISLILAVSAKHTTNVPYVVGTF